MYAVVASWDYHGPGVAVYGPYESEEAARNDLPAIEVNHTNLGVLPTEEISLEFEVVQLDKPYSAAFDEARIQLGQLTEEGQTNGWLGDPWHQRNLTEARERVAKLENWKPSL